MTGAARKKNGVANGESVRRRDAHSFTPDPTTFKASYAIVFVPDEHVRKDWPNTSRVARLARAVERQGQLSPILVERGGPPGFLFTLVDGAKQMAAFERLGWTDREILVRVVNDARDPVVRLAIYWSANTLRSPLTLLEQARMIHALFSGTYPTRVEQRGRRHTVAEIAKVLGVTRARVTCLLRVHRRLHEDIVHAVESAQVNGLLVPSTLLLAMTEKTRDEDSDGVRLETQTKIFTEWTDKKLALRSSREARR